MQGLKLIFAGTPDFAARHLQALLSLPQHEVVAVYTQPDRPSGRGKKLTASPVKALAVERHLPLHQPVSLKSDTTQQQLAEYGADLMVVVAYGLLLPKTVLSIPRLGCINVHASLLPRWRGAAPIQRAIEAGDTQTGITIMQMDEGLDTGAILARVTCDIGATDSAGTVQDNLARLGADILLATLADAANETLVAQQQDNSLVTYAHKITKDEALLDWSQPAVNLARKIRAFNPQPVAFATLGGSAGERVRIWQAAPVSRQHQAAPGEILSCNEAGILVACGNDALLLIEIQLPGKRRMAVGDVLKGHPDWALPGIRFGS